MAEFKQTVRELGQTVKNYGKEVEIPDYYMSKVYEYSEIRVIYTLEGIFEGLFFSAIENGFFVTKDYEVSLILPVKNPRSGEDESDFRATSDELQEQMEKYLAWRLEFMKKIVT